MAKKKKNKGGGASEAKSESKADASASASSASSAASAPAAAMTTGNKLVDTAFKSGNYAAVRHFAKTAPEAQKLVELTKIDIGQAVVGLIALIVVLSVAIATLH
jgi:hypothetical protein